MPAYVLQRDELARVGRALFERGLVRAGAANISVRLPDGEGWLISPTNANFGNLDPARLAHVGPDGRQISGDRASKALLLHRRIYDTDPAARCVLHAGSTHLLALTLAPPGHGVWQNDCVLPPFTPNLVMLVGRVPLIGYHRPGDPQVAEQVAREITQAQVQCRTLRAVLLDRLGPLVWHSTPAAAMTTLDELEHAARLWLMTTPRPTPLSPERIEDLSQHFVGATW